MNDSFPQDKIEHETPAESTISDSNKSTSHPEEEMFKWIERAMDKRKGMRTHYPFFFLYFFIPILPFLVTLVKRDFDAIFVLLFFWSIAFVFSFIPVLGWIVIVFMNICAAGFVARRKPKTIQATNINSSL